MTTDPTGPGQAEPPPEQQTPLDPEAVALCHRLALLKAFCLPSISGLLIRTGEFEQRLRKRYDDSGLMVAELLRHGPDSTAAIANADFLSVLSGFVAEPIRWLGCYGWRPLRDSVQQALHRFWRHVGMRMGITALPATLFRNATNYGAHLQLEQLGPPALLERLNQPRWSGRQRRIGLSGGIASGKSRVGALLATRGLPVLDADTYAREALEPGSAATEAVLARYGAQVRATDTQVVFAPAIDRAALGRIVFADAAERQWLEQLLHPIVRERFATELERLAGEPTVVLMIPLLFEAGLEGLCSEVWLVDCEEDQQLQRLMARDGLSENEARARIAAQWPLARKRPLAEVLIDNRGSPDQLSVQVEQALQGLSDAARHPVNDHNPLQEAGQDARQAAAMKQISAPTIDPSEPCT